MKQPKISEVLQPSDQENGNIAAMESNYSDTVIIKAPQKYIPKKFGWKQMILYNRKFYTIVWPKLKKFTIKFRGSIRKSYPNIEKESAHLQLFK